MTATAVITYVGRALTVRPASLGSMLSDYCTIVRRVMERALVKNPTTGAVFYQSVYKSQPIPLFWTDFDKRLNEECFCTYSGFGYGIQRLLEKQGISVTVEDRVSTGLEAPDYARVQHVQWRADQKRVLASIIVNRGGVVKCAMGFGKTFLLKQLVRLYPQSKILIVAARRDNVRAPYEDLVAEYGKHTIGLVTAGKHRVARVTVATAKSLHKCPKDVNLLIVDEAHDLCTTSYIKALNQFYRAKCLAFTATPDERGDNADRLLEAAFGPILIDISTQRAEQNGNILPVKVRVYRIPAGPPGLNIDVITNQVKLDRVGIWTNKVRNQFIRRVVREDIEPEVGPDAQILIMVDRTDHAYRLGQLLPDYAIVTGKVTDDRILELRANGALTDDQKLCTVKDRDQYRRAFADGTLKRVIATKVWQQGVDFKNLAMLVRADGKADEIGSNQIPGRVVRLGPESKTCGYLIDFNDEWSRKLTWRWTQRERTYKSNGWSIEVR